MPKMDEQFQHALAGKKIPILTLDNKWHRLFTQSELTPEIKALENELNGLVRRQGKVTTENREIKKLKKKLMDEIVVLADEMSEKATRKQEKDMEDHKRLINECNEKMKGYEEEIIELPHRINQVNNRLMLLTMEVCYKKLKRNTEDLKEIDAWITSIRRELKKKVIRKQEKEAMNNRLYGYMHDIFGADVVELFDMEYNPEGKKPEEKTEEKKPEENKAEDKESVEADVSDQNQEKESGDISEGASES